MGVEVQLRLFDRDAYARLVDAHRRWQRARDAAPFVEVLRQTLAKVQANAPRRAALEAREREIEREIDALPVASGPEVEAELARFQQSVAEAARRQHAAMQRGDDAGFLEAMQAASSIQVPRMHDRARVALVAEMLELSEDPPGPCYLEEAHIQETIAVLANAASTPEQREEAVSGIAPSLVHAHAIAWDREPRADVGIGRGDLPRWLIENTDWIGNFAVLGAATGEQLELDDSTRLFTRDEVVRFRDELARLPPPPDRHLAERVARVRRLVEIALSDPQLALGVSVS